jgi:hypothetical protein
MNEIMKFWVSYNAGNFLTEDLLAFVCTLCVVAGKLFCTLSMKSENMSWFQNDSALNKVKMCEIYGAV